MQGFVRSRGCSVIELKQFKFRLLDGSCAFYISESTVSSSEVSLRKSSGMLGKMPYENLHLGSIVQYLHINLTGCINHKFSGKKQLEGK